MNATAEYPPDQDIAAGVDNESFAANQRKSMGRVGLFIATLCVLYTAFHIGVMNFYPLETWTYRLIHVGGGLSIGFLLYSSISFTGTDGSNRRGRDLLILPGLALILVALMQAVLPWLGFGPGVDQAAAATCWRWTFGLPLAAGTAWVMLIGWTMPEARRARLDFADVALALAAIATTLYIIHHAPLLRLRAGTALAKEADMWAALVGVILILELTRRMAGLALVIITSIFIIYSFIGPWLPGILYNRGYSVTRFFTYIFTDQGILGPTIALSSTYIILFVAFAAFLQASRVGGYFVNFAFAAAGDRRGGPAKVAVFGSGLMGMINGTSDGNVVATASLTIPLMKKFAYKPQTAAAIEAAASSGGQILPPIMGAGAFIMSEITGIPYSEIVIAAIIPALLYFASVYFNVDLAAQKYDMRGIPRDQLPKFSRLARQAFLFIPIVILIGALFMGYSVIRAGTLSMGAAPVVSWFTPYRMGVKKILFALEISTKLTLQLVAVCAAAGIIVGVIALTGLGTRFSSLLLGLAENTQIVALFFAMVVSIILGMGIIAKDAD